ncbi:MAG: sodium/proline symporter, partial [Pseudomonadota bacterium]
MNVTLITLIVYACLLLGIGLWAQRRTHSNSDYLLGGRALGPWVAGISASASSSSAWTLLGVSGAAYYWGLSAIWLFPATLGGFLINWLVVAPRLQAISQKTGALTLSEVLAPAELNARRAIVLRVAAMIILFSFVFYIASQFEGAAKAFDVYFGWPRELGILLGVAVVLAYTLLGGFWAASVSDTLQGLMMSAAALILPIAALIHFGGAGGFMEAFDSSATASAGALTGEFGGVAALLFVLGTLGIGLGYPGQPHVVNRFMALKDESSLRRARVIALTWAVLIYSGMLIVGWSARSIIGELADGEQALFLLSEQLLPAVVSGVLLAAVLSAIMSTADSQLLVAASTLSHDWNLAQRGQASSMGHSRGLLIVLCVLSALLAIYLPDENAPCWRPAHAGQDSSHATKWTRQPGAGCRR